MKMTLPEIVASSKDVRGFVRWFGEENGREPATILELVDFLTQQREAGQFPDNSAINALAHHIPTLVPNFEIRAFLAGFEGGLLTTVETLTPDETAYLFLRVHQIADKHDPVFKKPAAAWEQADDPEPHDQTFHGSLEEYERAHDEWLQRNPVLS